MLAMFRGGVLHGELIKLPDGTKSFRAHQRPRNSMGYNSIWFSSDYDEYELTYDFQVKIIDKTVWLFDTGLTDIWLAETDKLQKSN